MMLRFLVSYGPGGLLRERGERGMMRMERKREEVAREWRYGWREEELKEGGEWYCQRTWHAGYREGLWDGDE
jgi:hypothetical protein